ncbi:MAG TPA: cytochrome c oxidase subunit II, partial [Candidatus Limnocylindrales bacterium]|nr:cytochrome c oxidase subunit II [Candidatus Limnocylindrales bacterium]
GSRRLRLRRRGRGHTAIALGAVAGMLAGCLPAAATQQARAVTDLWTVFIVAAAGVGIVVWGLITFDVLRYRRRRSDGTTLPPQIHDAARLEVAWTAIPIVIVLVLFWLTLGALDRIDARTPGKVTVDVTAFRWQWAFAYEGTSVRVIGGPDTPAEMVVPAGEPIHIVLTATDVAHAFFVPAFLFKRDAIPGRVNEFDITIDEPGAYGGQCAEFCGVFHDRMLLTVRAVTRPEYDAWLAGRAAPSGSAGPAASGSTLP